jgi:hypothetical protein
MGKGFCLCGFKFNVLRSPLGRNERQRYIIASVVEKHDAHLAFHVVVRVFRQVLTGHRRD